MHLAGVIFEAEEDLDLDGVLELDADADADDDDLDFFLLFRILNPVFDTRLVIEGPFLAEGPFATEVLFKVINISLISSLSFPISTFFSS